MSKFDEALEWKFQEQQERIRQARIEAQERTDVRVVRTRVVAYEVVEYVDISLEDYAAVLERIEAKSLLDVPPKQADEAIDAIVGDEWESESNEPSGDRILTIYVEGETL